MVLDQFTSRSLASHDNASCRIDRWSLGLSLEILHGSRNTRDCRYEGAEPIEVSKGQTNHPCSPLHSWDCSAALPPLRIRWGSLCPAAAATSRGRGSWHFLPPRTCLCRWRRFPSAPSHGILDLSLVRPAPPQGLGNGSDSLVGAPKRLSARRHRHWPHQWIYCCWVPGHRLARNCLHSVSGSSGGNLGILLAYRGKSTGLDPTGDCWDDTWDVGPCYGWRTGQHCLFDICRPGSRYSSVCLGGWKHSAREEQCQEQSSWSRYDGTGRGERTLPVGV